RAQIGGVPVPIGTLSRLVGTAVTVHGQSDPQRLRDPDAQRAALARFGAAEIGPLLSRHRKAWRRCSGRAGRLAELEEIAPARGRRGTGLREGLERIARPAPQRGEEQALRTELERLGNAEERRPAASQAALALVADEGPAAAALVE